MLEENLSQDELEGHTKVWVASGMPRYSGKIKIESRPSMEVIGRAKNMIEYQKPFIKCESKN